MRHLKRAVPDAISREEEEEEEEEANVHTRFKDDWASFFPLLS